mmetsp:Transcript_47734/g.153658  ORF Transcript_47734/g.153658 Transcript_47734/m.153658 type:complete len:226 (+) Transcript_47734:3138-3815(+)
MLRAGSAWRTRTAQARMRCPKIARGTPCPSTTPSSPKVSPPNRAAAIRSTATSRLCGLQATSLPAPRANATAASDRAAAVGPRADARRAPRDFGAQGNWPRPIRKSESRMASRWIGMGSRAGDSTLRSPLGRRSGVLMRPIAGGHLTHCCGRLGAGHLAWRAPIPKTAKGAIAQASRSAGSPGLRARTALGAGRASRAEDACLGASPCRRAGCAGLAARQQQVWL